MKVHEFMHEMRMTSAILGRTSNISVVFEGDKAATDGKTIYLPALPQHVDLTQEQVLAMRGYVDHEAGHNRHSNMPRIVDFYDKNHHNGREDLSRIHNSLEDVWMEEKVLEEYPGSWKNLRQVNEMVRSKEATIEGLGDDIASDPNKATRASVNWNKNPDFQTETTRSLRSKYLTEKQDEMGQYYRERAVECADTDEVIELAKKVFQYVNSKPPEEQSPEDFEKMEGQGELSDLKGEEGEGENSPGFKKGQEGEGSGRGDRMDEASDNMGDILTSSEEDVMGAGGIGKCVDNGLRGGYKVFSTAKDLEYRRGKPSGKGNRGIQSIVDDTKHWSDYDEAKACLRSEFMVMKNKLRRSLMARQQRDWDFARESGRLDSKRLVAASQGVKQVWKRRTDREDTDTAISVLVDLSGSMGGTKAAVARDCAILLSECFEGTNMSYRISGFSNRGGYGYGGYGEKARYHRYEALNHVVFKDYDDSLRVTRGSVYLIPSAVGGNNSDYDFVDRELFGLSRRSEKRRVLFVLSDGHVACASDAPTSEHNRLIKENLKYYKSKYSVESVGIGIQSSAVSQIYPDHVTVDEPEDLSGAAFNMLTNILFRDKK